MEYISSDTNIWIDFYVLGIIDWPFRLNYCFLMNADAAEKEIIYPETLKEDLINLGLQLVEITEEEFYLANDYSNKYLQLSAFDCAALAIAKRRGIKLLSGDKPLRNAAEKEDVVVEGTLGIVDELLENKLVTRKEYSDCLTKIKEVNHKRIRLPDTEIDKRIEIIKNGDD